MKKMLVGPNLGSVFSKKKNPVDEKNVNGTQSGGRYLA